MPSGISWCRGAGGLLAVPGVAAAAFIVSLILRARREIAPDTGTSLDALIWSAKYVGPVVAIAVVWLVLMACARRAIGATAKVVAGNVLIVGSMGIAALLIVENWTS